MSECGKYVLNLQKTHNESLNTHVEEYLSVEGVEGVEGVKGVEGVEEVAVVVEGVEVKCVINWQSPKAGGTNKNPKYGVQG